MSDDLEPTDDLSPDDVLTSLARQFLGHPGFMWAGDGFEVLHADWPAYPRGHGLRAALNALADFPSPEPFHRIDSIDQCSLFLVGRKPDSNSFSTDLFHVALWDDDLREGANHKVFAGIASSSDYLEFEGGAFTVTPHGEEVSLLLELTRRVHPDLFSYVESLLMIGRYDSAVREASIMLENRLCAAAAELEGKRGLQLVDAWCQRFLPGPPTGQVTNAQRLELRASLRRFFKYVRNEFAHNLVDIDVVPTARLLTRCSLLLEVTTELARIGTA